MERVLVLGSPGSGKATFARQLAAPLGLPVFHLDQIYWSPGWVETPPEQFRAVQRALVRGERWIIDGEYGPTLELRLAAADTVVVLDLPRTVCAWRIVKRVLIYGRGAGPVRPDLAPGCPERFDGEFVGFLRYVWRYPRDRCPQWTRVIERQARPPRVIRLGSPRAVRASFARLPARRGPAGRGSRREANRTAHLRAVRSFVTATWPGPTTGRSRRACDR